jgi:hypothetical protein
VIGSESIRYSGQLDWSANIRAGQLYDSFNPDRDGAVAIIDRYTSRPAVQRKYRPFAKAAVNGSNRSNAATQEPIRRSEKRTFTEALRRRLGA